MTSPSDELLGTLARVSKQNAAIRDAAREAADQANTRREAEIQEREVTPDAGTNPGS